MSVKQQYNDLVYYSSSLNEKYSVTILSSSSSEDFPDEMLELTSNESKKLAYLFREWLQLKPRHQQILALRILHPEWDMSQLAKTIGIARKNLYRNFQEILEVNPNFLSFTPYANPNIKHQSE